MCQRLIALENLFRLIKEIELKSECLQVLKNLLWQRKDKSSSKRHTKNKDIKGSLKQFEEREVTAGDKERQINVRKRRKKTSTQETKI